MQERFTEGAPMKDKLLIYGVTGYTGALISRMAAQAGVAHIAAGRDLARVREHADAHGLEARAFSLDDSAAADAALADVACVLNTAGPFAKTATLLVEACLRSGAHYLDIAGEVLDFEEVRRFDAQAQARGIMLMPGVGFGVVPTDVAAAKLKERHPDAEHLRIAFEAVGGVSQGTLATLFRDIGKAGVRRSQGELVPAQPAEETHRIDLGDGARVAVTNPWRADLMTAYHSTGIGTIDTYTVFPAPVRWLMKARKVSGWVFARPSVQRLLGALFRRLPAGPSEEELRRGKTLVWAEAKDNHGRATIVRIRGPEAYLFTALTAIECAKRALKSAPSGFQTPTRAYGSGMIDQLAGVEVSYA